MLRRMRFVVVLSALVALAVAGGGFALAPDAARKDGLPRYVAACLLAGYAWLALGSHGRGEQVLSSDQDSALAYGGPETRSYGSYAALVAVC